MLLITMPTRRWHLFFRDNRRILNRGFPIKIIIFIFAASDPYGESVTLLRAIGLRYGAVVIIGGGLASSILYLLRSEVKIFTAKGFVNHVMKSREDLCSGTHKLF